MKIAEKALKGFITEEEFDLLTNEQKDRYNRDSSRWEYSRQEAKKLLADIDDVRDSFKKLTPVMAEMPDPAKIPAFVEILLESGITKWEVKCATMEIIRSRCKMTAPAEYFHALNRIKTKLQPHGHNIFHDKALDF
jgi:hypothetical protein